MPGPLPVHVSFRAPVVLAVVIVVSVGGELGRLVGMLVDLAHDGR